MGEAPKHVQVALDDFMRVHFTPISTYGIVNPSHSVCVILALLHINRKEEGKAGQLYADSKCE